jgi:hypothetical protein
MAGPQEPTQAVPYVRGEASFRIAAEATPEQICQWVDDWYELWNLEVCGGDRRVERFILCCSRLAAVAEIRELVPGPLLTFIGELGEASLAGRIPSKSDSHLRAAQDVVERVDSWANGQIEKAKQESLTGEQVKKHPENIEDSISSRIANEASPSRKSLDSLLDDAWMTHLDLAGALALESEPLRTRLNRWRRKHQEGWREVTEPEARQPKYLYQIGAIRTVLRDAMAAARSAK